MTPMVTAIAKS